MKNKWNIHIGLAIGMIGGWLMLVFLPSQKEINTLDQKVMEANGQLSDYYKTMALLPSFVEARRNMVAMKHDLNSKLYTKEDVIYLLNQIQDMASSRNLTVTEMTPPVEELLKFNSGMPDSLDPQIMNIGLSMTGSFQQFGKLVGDIETSDFYHGLNMCRIIGSHDNRPPSLHLNFRALVGGFAEES